MRILRAAVPALLAVAALTACSNGQTPASPPPQDDLLNRTFVSTTVSGTPIPGGGPLTVEFVEPDRISATAGCNRASGTVDLRDGKLTTGTLATTMMACIGDKGEADAWMTSLLEASPAWSLTDDTLTLRSDSTTVTLLDKKVAQPDRPLVGTTWVVDTTIDPNAITTSAALEQSTPTLTIAPDGNVTGSTGCNRFTGTAQVSGDTVTFGPLATTRMACMGEVADVERAVLTVLDGQTTATVDADRLRLMRADGHGLGLHAQ
ncbi:META domain-containing protein [Rhodococcus spelaei]|uniref:META domain-containing protein n=1 Tax=Rhodococcus spelaei TaxID=2546320 RepID=A0A541BLR8_9NOCA|nr:META domain-containing protein [Rhodococcus spelaei]TQF73273.1 META domain-containing protein [Rhodococcus spelaei]